MTVYGDLDYSVLDELPPGQVLGQDHSGWPLRTRRSSGKPVRGGRAGHGRDQSSVHSSDQATPKNPKTIRTTNPKDNPDNDSDNVTALAAGRGRSALCRRSGRCSSTAAGGSRGGGAAPRRTACRPSARPAPRPTQFAGEGRGDDRVSRRSDRRARRDDGRRSRRGRTRRDRDGDRGRRPLRHRAAAPVARPGRSGRSVDLGEATSSPTRSASSASVGSRRSVRPPTGSSSCFEVDLELRGEGTVLGVRQKGRSDLRLASAGSPRPRARRRGRRAAEELVAHDPAPRPPSAPRRRASRCSSVKRPKTSCAAERRRSAPVPISLRSRSRYGPHLAAVPVSLRSRRARHRWCSRRTTASAAVVAHGASGPSIGVREGQSSDVLATLSAVEDSSVLDLFAGSGALGIEALSRRGERAQGSPAVTTTGNRHPRKPAARPGCTTRPARRSFVQTPASFSVAGSVEYDLALWIRPTALPSGRNCLATYGPRTVSSRRLARSSCRLRTSCIAPTATELRWSPWRHGSTSGPGRQSL